MTQAELARLEQQAQLREIGQLEGELAKLQVYAEWVNHPYTRNLRDYFQRLKILTIAKIRNREFKNTEEIHRLLDKEEIYGALENFLVAKERDKEYFCELYRQIREEKQ